MTRILLEISGISISICRFKSNSALVTPEKGKSKELRHDTYFLNENPSIAGDL